MKNLRATILDLGSNYSDGNFFEAGKYEPGTHLTNTPFYGVLIDHPTAGLILYDTGDPDKNNWPEALRPLCDVVDEPGKNIVDQLALLGYKVEDVKHVIVSHMHIDHIGGLHYFEKTATIYVNKTEFEFALSLTHQSDDDNAFGFYVRSLVDVMAKKVVLIEQDQELFEGVHLINVAGHVPGLMALRVELESGDVLFTSDAANMASNYFEGVPGGIVSDGEGAKQSVAKLQRIQKENNIPDDRVIFSHDDVQFAKLVKAPKWF
ncbi:MAG: N-acyl homoserine lactonase family protein [Bacilli bacterium]|nr:N-acyl homoserine lactonase family protein [Bacilli bacterium]